MCKGRAFMGCLRKSRRSAWLKQSERAHTADEVKRVAGTQATQGPAQGCSFHVDFRKVSYNPACVLKQCFSDLSAYHLK